MHSIVEVGVRDAEFWRALVRRCQRMLKSAVEPEVIEQLHMWVIEFAEQAHEASATSRIAKRDPVTLVDDVELLVAQVVIHTMLLRSTKWTPSAVPVVYQPPII